MFAEGYSFPHPVYGNEDDISGTFNVSMRVQRSDSRKIEFLDFSCNVSNDYIKALINDGFAGYFIKIYCSSTLSTWFFEYRPSKFAIDENELVNKVEVQVIILAKKDIKKFCDSSFHDQFRGRSFFVSQNEIIGISGKFVGSS